jgi:hypothetical protein
MLLPVPTIAATDDIHDYRIARLLHQRRERSDGRERPAHIGGEDRVDQVVRQFLQVAVTGLLVADPASLAHPEQASLNHLEGVGLQISEQEEQPIFRRRQRASVIDGKPAGSPGSAIKAPHRHVRLKCRLEGPGGSAWNSPARRDQVRAIR